MKKDIAFFRALSFLTTFFSSEGRDYYIEFGFSKEAMIESILSTLSMGLEKNNMQEKWPSYCEKVKDHIDQVLETLQAANLIKQDEGLYFITDQGLDMCDFMMDMSKSLFPEITDAQKAWPYRFFPGSSQVYGLN